MKRKYVRTSSTGEVKELPDDSRHGEHFLMFVQILLCHAWTIGFLESELWETIPNIALAAEIHDLGKMALPKELINKPGGFNSEEKEFMKTHTILGATMIELNAPQFRDTLVYEYAIEICRHHHERIDGQGYPDGLCGDEIPSYVQVASLADVYDALRTPRSYRGELSENTALRMLYNGECGAFDPILLESFAPAIESFWKLAHTVTGVTQDT